MLDTDNIVVLLRHWLGVWGVPADGPVSVLPRFEGNVVVVRVELITPSGTLYAEPRLTAWLMERSKGASSYVAHEAGCVLSELWDAYLDSEAAIKARLS